MTFTNSLSALITSIESFKPSSIPVPLIRILSDVEDDWYFVRKTNQITIYKYYYKSNLKVPIICFKKHNNTFIPASLKSVVGTTHNINHVKKFLSLTLNLF